MRAIDRLLKVAGTDRKIFKEVEIKGEDFSFWMKPLTIAEQQAAQKQAKSDDANDFAIQLLILMTAATPSRWMPVMTSALVILSPLR